jgi:hypothetical protein
MMRAQPFGCEGQASRFNHELDSNGVTIAYHENDVWTRDSGR